MLQLFAIAYALLELGGIAAAVHAILNARSSQGSIAWAISLIAMPAIAVPLYLIFGRNRFLGYVKARRDLDNRIAEEIQSLTITAEGYAETANNADGRDLDALEKLALMAFTGGNKLELLVDGEAIFAAMFDTIERARHYVLVQFFIVRDDQIGRQMQQLLARKSSQGVRVYFLYDEIGSYSLPGKYIDECRQAGIEIRAFRTRQGRFNRFQVNFRNHRKTVVVDGETAFIGGANLGDEYLGRDPKIGDWRDTYVQISGPAVTATQIIFVEDWNWASGRLIEQLNWSSSAIPNSTTTALALPSGPADKLESCNLMFLRAINAAKDRFWIASPYFVPNAEIVAALQLAGLRGVDVRILLPANPDHLLVHLASFDYIRRTGSDNVRFFRYTEGFMHQKVFLVDDFAAGIGTANLDNRSFRLNFELTLLVACETFAGDVQTMLEKDFAAAEPVEADEINLRGLGFRLASKSAGLLSPIL